MGKENTLAMKVATDQVMNCGIIKKETGDSPAMGCYDLLTLVAISGL